MEKKLNLEKQKKEKLANFLKGFCKINIKSICKKYDVDASNVTRNRTSLEKTELVVSELNKEIIKLYCGDEGNG